MDDDCPFCRIARGEDSSAEIVCESPVWIAFFPPAPATPGHTLVVPREHVPDYWSLRGDLAAELSSGAIRVGHAIREALAPDGMNLITSSGEVAEQTVMHVHLHVVPRYRNDAIGPIWPGKEQTDSAVLGELAARVRAACSVRR
jgi:histidine triad (HIT) family protein